MLVLVPPLFAQQPPQESETQLLDLRITAVGTAGSVTIDRGRRDGVLPNDLISFRTRNGEVYRGTVLRVEERSSLVELQDRSVTAEPGTRGEVRVPKSRLATAPPTPPQPSPTGTEPTPKAGEHPAWQNPDKGYEPGMPLLAQVRPLQPEQRAARLTGRMFSTLNFTRTGHDDWSNSYFRLGTDAEVENPFGNGGRLQFDLEFDRRTERNDRQGVDLLLRRLSYQWGGNRFEPRRWELGRFLQHGVPELGVLDGVEFGQRLGNGDRAGASLGFMPVPDDDFDSGRDFQIAGYYEWVLDDEEITKVTAAAQFSWHNAADDRDLVLLKYDHAPPDDWRYHATAWIDLYLGGEPAGQKGVEVTQAIAYAGRHWRDGTGVDLTYRHIHYPDILRWEFWRVTANEVRRDRYDRFDLNAWTRNQEQRRLHGNLNVWNDERDTAAGGEAGIEVPDWPLDHSRCDFTAFATLGRFTTVFGGRVTLGRFTDGGHWELLYELSHQDMLDRPSDGNDLLQHRLGFSQDFYLDQSWTFALNVDAVWWDGDPALSAGAYLQKTF